MTTATWKRARREETAVAGNELMAVNVVIDGTVKRARMELKTVGADPILTHRADPNLTQGGTLRF
jgi:hypothetical protein